MSEQAYLNMLENLNILGVSQDNRTGIDAIRRVFNADEYNTNYGCKYNLFSHKRLNPDSIIGELIGFVQGSTSAADFRKHKCNVWNQNANEHGVRPNAWLSNPNRKGEDDLGPIYGKQWRMWEDTKYVPVSTIEGDLGTMMWFEKHGYSALGKLNIEGVNNYVMRRKIDQLARAVHDIRTNPTSRRTIISAWNVGDLEFMALPPCHVLQHYLCTELSQEERLIAVRAKAQSDMLWDKHHEINFVQGEFELEPSEAQSIWDQLNDYKTLSEDSLDQLGAPRYRLDLVMWQRSVDTVLGAPYNVASYDTMLNIMSRLTRTAPGSLHYLTSDTHIYNNHLDAVGEILQRGKHPENNARLLINPRIKNVQDLDSLTLEDFVVVGYENHGKLINPTPMAI
jgi:thymidylate synthase